MIKVSDSAMAKNDGCSYQVLLEAESWSPSLLEDRALELLEVANTVLSRSDSSHEMKLDCLRWIGDKLVSHVLMGEMEDYILKPFLPSALDFIEEIISVTVDTSHGNTLELSAIMVSLLQQSNKVRFVFIIDWLTSCYLQVVRHCNQPQSKLGEMPSLSQVVPKILMSSFKFLLSFQPSEESQSSHLSTCFTCCKELLQSFLVVIGAIRIRLFLDDELALLVVLCQDLVDFHDVLVRLDFKLSLMVWRVYIQLTSKHQEKLTNQMDLSLATNKISSELIGNFRQLRSLLSSREKDPNAVKITMKVVHFLKAFLLVAAQSIGRWRSLLGVLQELLVGLPDCPVWLPEVAKNNIIAVILSPLNKQTLISLAAAQEHFLSNLIAHHQEEGEEPPGPLLVVCVELLLDASHSHHHNLFLACLKLVNTGGCCLKQPKHLLSRESQYQPAQKVDTYTWTLTNLSHFLVTRDKEQFRQVEKILLTTLLDPSSSLVSLMLVSDLWCFSAKISSKLRLSHMKILRSVKAQLESRGSSLTVLVVDALLARLEPFLRGGEAAQWRSQQPVEDVPLEDRWRKLAEGEYHPGSGSSSLVRISEETVRRLPSLPEEKVKTILQSCHHLVTLSQYKAEWVVLCLRLVRLVAGNRKYSPDCLHVLTDIVDQTSASRNSLGGSAIAFQISSTYGRLKAPVPAEISCEENISDKSLPSDCPCQLWSADKSNVFNEKMQFSVVETLPETEPDYDKSPEPKRRKTEDEKENIELALSRLDSEIEFLSRQNSTDLKPFSASLRTQAIKLEEILKTVGCDL